MNWGVVVSALLTLLILAIREYMKTRNLVLALIAEAEDGRDRISWHLRVADWEAVKTNMRADKEYVPYLSIYPSPDHLYRKAIDDCYLLPKRPTRTVLLANKREIACAALIENLQSDAFKAMSIERKEQYIDTLVSDFKTLDRDLYRMIKRLNQWKSLSFTLKKAIKWSKSIIRGSTK